LRIVKNILNNSQLRIRKKHPEQQPDFGILEHPEQQSAEEKKTPINQSQLLVI
jgi:hypothetical protein